MVTMTTPAIEIGKITKEKGRLSKAAFSFFFFLFSSSRITGTSLLLYQANCQSVLSGIESLFRRSVPPGMTTVIS